LKKRSCFPLTKQEFWKSITKSTHSWCNNISIYTPIFWSWDGVALTGKRSWEREIPTKFRFAFAMTPLTSFEELASTSSNFSIDWSNCEF
jgi:hypothetical protein